MSKMINYHSNRDDEMRVLSGRIKSISEDRTTCEVTYRDFNTSEKKWYDQSKKVQPNNGVPENYKVGDMITAEGPIVRGGAMLATNFGKELYIEVPPTDPDGKNGTAVIAGFISALHMNEELDRDGNHKLTKTGSPKKPHYDIYMDVPNEDGEIIKHVVKIYLNDKFMENGISQTQKQVNRFEGLGFDNDNPGDTPVYATILTTLGNAYEGTYRDETYKGMSHGPFIKNFEVTPLFTKKKTKAVTNEKAEEVKEEVKEDADKQADNEVVAETNAKEPVEDKAVSQPTVASGTAATNVVPPEGFEDDISDEFESID